MQIILNNIVNFMKSTILISAKQTTINSSWYNYKTNLTIKKCLKIDNKNVRL